MNEISEKLQDYIKRLTEEKESLAAKFIAETGLKPSQVVICDAPTKDGLGRIFWFDKKENILGKDNVAK